MIKSFSAPEVVAPGRAQRLGLSIVHRAVQTLGGPIELDSTPGRGTEFRVPLTADGLGAVEARTDPGLKAASPAR